MFKSDNCQQLRLQVGRCKMDSLGDAAKPGPPACCNDKAPSEHQAYSSLPGRNSGCGIHVTPDACVPTKHFFYGHKKIVPPGSKSRLALVALYLAR